MRKMRTILQELGHQEIDILKMDIEGSEFKVINDIMNPEVEKVKLGLLCMETHERFSNNNKICDNLYEIMMSNGYYDLYGVIDEPVFVKVSRV